MKKVLLLRFDVYSGELTVRFLRFFCDLLTVSNYLIEVLTNKEIIGYVSK